MTTESKAQKIGLVGSKDDFLGLTGPALGVQLSIVCAALRRSNHLAKQLTGLQQYDAYRTKADLVSVLVLAGCAKVNGIQAHGVVGLNVLSEPIARVHVPLRHLHPDAQIILYQQMTSALDVAPLAKDDQR